MNEGFRGSGNKEGRFARDMTDVRLTVLLRAPRIRALENAFREGLRNEAPDWVPGVRGGTLADALRRVDEPTIRRVGWAHATTGR